MHSNHFKHLWVSFTFLRVTVICYLPWMALDLVKLPLLKNVCCHWPPDHLTSLVMSHPGICRETPEVCQFTTRGQQCLPVFLMTTGNNTVTINLPFKGEVQWKTKMCIMKEYTKCSVTLVVILTSSTINICIYMTK